jgi:hypothetical protein
VALIANFLKQNFPDEVFGRLVDLTIADMPTDPALFPDWKKQTAFETLETAKKFENDFTQQNLGTSTRIVSTPKFGGGVATVVPGSEAAITMKPQIVDVEGIGPVFVDTNTGIGYPVSAGAVGGIPQRGVAGAPSAGTGTGNTADVVYGFGEYARPPKPISSMTIGEVQNFQKNELIPATRGEIGKGPRIGTGAVGTYQIVYGTLRDYAPKVLGPNWRNVQFTADVQDRIAKAIYEDVKDRNLKDTWAGLPANRPGAYSNVPWEQVRDKIIQVESAGGGRGRGAAGAAEGGGPMTVGQAAKLPGRQRVSRIISDMLKEYETLNKAGAIPSTERGALENIGDYFGVTTVGKEVQKALGTKASKSLSNIEAARKLLTTAIKNASGMSQKEMDSNTELQLTLASLSDATQGYEAVVDILKRIDEEYGMAGTPAAAPTTGAKAKSGSGWGKAKVVGE